MKHEKTTASALMKGAGHTALTWLLMGMVLFLPFFFSACGESASPPVKPPEIRVVDVIQRDQPIFVELVGETRGSFDIPIRTRVEGVLLGMHFIEGNLVEKGDLLYTIDPLPYEIDVIEAEGSLAEAEVRLANTKADLQRIQPLAEIGAVSQIELDGAMARSQAAQAGVKSALARLERQRIELGFTSINAPISGRIGISAATVGEFVGRQPNPVVLNSVSVVDPFRVRFSLDERNYLRLAREAITERKAGKSDQDAPFQMILADGTMHAHKGRLIAKDAEIDSDTGTYTLEAEFANPDRLVLSGQFARVRVAIDQRKGALLVPQRAIRDLQGTSQVYVVDSNGIVALRDVEVGPRVDRLQVVEKGLTAGERVAIEIARLEPEMTVSPQLVNLNEDGSIDKRSPFGVQAASKNTPEIEE